MLLLMKVARVLAEQENAAEVTLQHVRRAMWMVELRQGDSSAVVSAYLGIAVPDRPSPPSHILQLIEKSDCSSTPPPSADVLEMLETFGSDFQCCHWPAILISNEDLQPQAFVAGKRPQRRTPEQQARISKEKMKASEGATELESDEVVSLDNEGWPWPADEPLKASRAVELSQDLRVYLSEHLLGQPHVVDALADHVVYQAMRGERTGPLATLFLIGPPGTGKSHTAKLLADALKNLWPIKTIDMSSMQSANQAFALTGLSRGYGEAVPGELTDFVRRYPRSIVVLDNIDKSHPNNQNVLLSMFDTGYLKDQFGFYEGGDHTKKQIAADEVDFRNTIVIVTTSAASGTLQNGDFQAYLEANPGQAQFAVLEVLANQTREYKEGAQQCFSPELLSRLSSQLVLIYKPLPLAALESIAQRTFDAFSSSLRSAFGCKVVAEDLSRLIRSATLSFGGNLDARKVAGSSLDNVMFDEVIDAVQVTGDTQPIKHIEFILDKNYSAALDELVSQLSAQEPVRELRRKQRSLAFDRHTERKGDRILVRWSAPRWITTARSTDFKGYGALQTVMPDCSFDDIAGHNHVKTRMKEIVRLLRSPGKLKQWDVEVPRGMLLYGAPGTGKTMLAKALAREADLPFIATTGPEILEIQQMQHVFERARYYAPSILFIDEIDILGSREAKGYPLSINQLLAEIDGFQSQTCGVFTVAATNFPERIDPAIVRSGRIELHVEVPALDPPARRYFFGRLSKLPGGDQLDHDALVRLSSGMSGADLERVRRELAIDLIRTDKKGVTQVDAEEMLSVVKYGERRSASSNKRTMEHAAYHEAGHALVSRALFPERRIEQISIVSRSNYRGMVTFDADQDRKPMTAESVLNEMAMCFAGRVAQRIKFGAAGVDDGASSDLEKATRLAQLAIGRWGLDEVVGCRIVDPSTGDASNVPIERVDWWIGQAIAIAETTLDRVGEVLESTVKKLIENEVMYPEEIEL